MSLTGVPRAQMITAMGVLCRVMTIAFTVTVASFAVAAQARPITVEGLTFSDELGGFTILAAWGTGTKADPIVVVEEITGPTAAILVIRGMTPEFGNRAGTLHPNGFILRKIVTNRTRFIWNVVDFELQQIIGVSSDTLDGLSFGQGAQANRPFKSNKFKSTSEVKEPLDFVTFHNGALRPGETATFDIVITDTTPVAVFYLVQRPNRPMSYLDAPRATVARAGP